MLNPFLLSQLIEFLETDGTFENLKEILASIKDETRSEEGEVSATFGHSLSNYQIDRLEFALSKKKSTSSLGKYLNKLAQEKGLPPVNDGTFGEANITKSYWSRLINDKLPTQEKNKLIRIAVFLKLSLKESLILLNKAGYTLSEDKKRDLVITFFLKEKLYDLGDIEEILQFHEMRSLYTNTR